MGRESLQALTPRYGFEVVGAVVRSEPEVPLREGLITAVDLETILHETTPDVVLDLSIAANALDVAQSALSRKIPVVSGVTGISPEGLEAIRNLCEANDTPLLLVPNFAIGAVLMMKFSELAARWLPDAEIIERHHEGKLDAPSGTAMLTAHRIAAGREKAPTVPETKIFKAEGARGGDVDKVRVHSLRLPGSLAHQEVYFGAPGETLVIRHDAADRSVYMPGVRLCLQRVSNLKGLIVGMDSLLFGE